jgi:transposase
MAVDGTFAIGSVRRRTPTASSVDSWEAEKVRQPMATTEVKRQRRRTAAEKVAIVIESLRSNEPNIQTCRRHGISEPTLYKWRQLFFAGGQLLLESGRMPSLAAVLEENRQLKETLAEFSLAYRRLRAQTSKGSAAEALTRGRRRVSARA